MQRALIALALALPVLVCGTSPKLLQTDVDGHHHKGHHHKGKHHKKHHINKEPSKTAPKAPVVAKPSTPVVAVAPTVDKAAVQAKTQVSSNIVDKMKALEAKLAAKAKAKAVPVTQGHLLVNGPLPADFNERFAQAVGHASGTDAQKVTVTDSSALEDNADVVEITFTAPPNVVKEVESDAADPSSKLAKGNLRPFLVAKEAPESAATSFNAKKVETSEHEKKVSKKSSKSHAAPVMEEAAATPVEEKGIDIDTQMPYGDLEPFGREDTAQELTESSVKESDEMVDQLERAEVAEEKRSVFRALTRLRGAAITSFDGVARSQTGNIDEYNKVHKWRNSHPLHHLADEESDVTKWAFPDNADF